MKLGWEYINDVLKGQVTCPNCGSTVSFERKIDDLSFGAVLGCPKCSFCWWEALSFQTLGIGKRF